MPEDLLILLARVLGIAGVMVLSASAVLGVFENGQTCPPFPTPHSNSPARPESCDIEPREGVAAVRASPRRPFTMISTPRSTLRRMPLGLPARYIRPRIGIVGGPNEETNAMAMHQTHPGFEGSIEKYRCGFLRLMLKLPRLQREV